MSDEARRSANPPPEIAAYYTRGSEAPRLTTGANVLELARTQELIMRAFPPPPAVICDVGGGPGVYACWLARLGYDVHLVDPIPLHVEQARQSSRAQPDAPLASCALGDARRLDCADASADGVLLLGPLYHLTEREDRRAALREAARITRHGGVICAAAISRFASALDGLRNGFIADPVFRSIMQEDLRSGQHRNLLDTPGYFTTAYFHQPAELRDELEAVDLVHDATLAIEGPAALIASVWERWDDPQWREQALSVLRALEAEPSLLGASPHLLAIGHKP